MMKDLVLAVLLTVFTPNWSFAYSVKSSCINSNAPQDAKIRYFSFEKATDGSVIISDDWVLALKTLFFPPGTSPFQSLSNLTVHDDGIFSGEVFGFDASFEENEHYIAMKWRRIAPNSPNGIVDFWFGKNLQKEIAYFTFDYCEGTFEP
jgi:hypothetical protein